MVLVPEVPAATEEEWADPGECPEGTRGTALPLPRIPGLPKPLSAEANASFRESRAAAGLAQLRVHALHARVRAVSEMVMGQIDEIMHRARSFQERNGNVYKGIR